MFRYGKTPVVPTLDDLCGLQTRLAGLALPSNHEEPPST